MEEGLYRVGGAYAYTWHSLLAARHLDSAESAGHVASAGPISSSEAGALSRHAISASLSPLLPSSSLSECDLQSDGALLRWHTDVIEPMLQSLQILAQVLLCGNGVLGTSVSGMPWFLFCQKLGSAWKGISKAHPSWVLAFESELLDVSTLRRFPGPMGLSCCLLLLSLALILASSSAATLSRPPPTARPAQRSRKSRP